MIPIFIICKDRITVLKQCIESYLKLEDVEIILLDNGSTYRPMLQYLETCPYVVIRNPYTTGTFEDISEYVGKQISEWLALHPDVNYYIVTDPDVELEHPSKELLKFYQLILDLYPDCRCVGPMLRIDDLPECFKFRDEMIKSHMEQFWDDNHTRLKVNNIIVQIAPIDTTFAMYRRNFRFQRLNWGMRVHEPYMAKHLDWYIDNNNITPEQRYYWDHASDVSTMKVHLRNGGMK